MVPLKIAIFDEVRKHKAAMAEMSDDDLNQLLFHYNNGLRLSFKGFLVLKNIFTVYSFEIDISLKARHQIGMSKMEYPYYVTNKRFILFSEMDAAVIKLQGGVNQFLENYFNMEK